MHRRQKENGLPRSFTTLSVGDRAGKYVIGMRAYPLPKFTAVNQKIIDRAAEK
jgi:hypothetical protein